MALSITPTTDLASNPPRVLLTLDTTGYTAYTLEIYRILDGVQTAVRSAETTPDIDDVTWVGYDYECPYGTAVTYQVVVFDGSTSIATATSASTTLSETSPWLIHPGDTDLSVELTGLRDLGSRKRQITQATQRVIGRADPVVVADARASVDSTMRVGTSTLAEATAVSAILDSGTPLLLNIPPSLLWGVTYEWIAAGDSEETRVVPQVGARPNRLITIPYLVVSRPEGDLLPTRTYADVLTEAASYSAVLASRASYTALLLGA